MTQGERVKKLREEQGLTQEQLAEKCGLSKMTISNIEAGRKMSARVWEIVFYTLGRPLIMGCGVGWSDDPKGLKTEDAAAIHKQNVEKEFQKQADSLWDELMGKVTDGEREIVSVENWLGFLKIIRLLKKYHLEPDL
jgi:transcriptional regulator with XRE-family HTH domain